ncbi:hypothetical protein INS49_012093 [Diaporthe citri]|uniref:uncharacterized protein n=1 Tax=Diaporthe citri TaxID=83186 RepID=UPI001C7ECEF0|nr:uncharacterized protein INS49_012093 [Diaporthe citri]KAG6358575.1 hypothetical protein INS49_012093 [Diaporthe citri]
MNPSSVVAVTPFRFMDLPQEIRDDIYEAAIFAFTPPGLLFSSGRDPSGWRYMNTNILLTNRKVYWEALDVVVRRAQLVMVSGSPVYHQSHMSCEVSMRILTDKSGITVIHPKYRNFCIMHHRINAERTTSRPDANKSVIEWQFILHKRDVKPFCHALMGKFDIEADRYFGPKSKHTLILHWPPTYAQRESMSIYETQSRILQQYRTILHGFKDISIRGAGTGWETGLYAAVLQDIRSKKDPPEFFDDIRDLEQEGSEILQQTAGDPEAANVAWTKALGICEIARMTFCLSNESFPAGISRRVLESDAIQLYTERWAQLRRQGGDECVVPIIELQYKLIANRVSGILRFIQKGGHLARSRGWAPPSIREYANLVLHCYTDSGTTGKCFQNDGWSPQPFQEAQLCCTVATIFRLLDASIMAETAFAAIRRACELAPDDEPIQQECCRIRKWIERLIDDGKLEFYPEFWFS